jgi:hypothetical protein
LKICCVNLQFFHFSLVTVQKLQTVAKFKFFCNWIDKGTRVFMILNFKMEKEGGGSLRRAYLRIARGVLFPKISGLALAGLSVSEKIGWACQNGRARFLKTKDFAGCG